MNIEAISDEQKVDQLFEKYYTYLVFRAEKILNSRDLAEDAAQETFLRLVKNNNLSKIEEIDSKRTRNFLIKILTNVALSLCMRDLSNLNTEYHDEFLYSLRGVTDPTWQEYLMGDIANKLKALVNALPEQDRNLLIYRNTQHLAFKEIAEFMGVSVNYATARFSRIYKKLKKELNR